MIDHLRLFGHVSRECGACHGLGILEDLEIHVRRWEDSSGHQQRDVWWTDRTGKRFETNTCERCGGTGAEAIRGAKQRASRNGYARCPECREGQRRERRGGPIWNPDGCHTCEGDGYVTTVPAFCHAQSHEPGTSPEEAHILRAANLMGVLSRASERYPWSAAVCQALYDDDGERWARSKRGRILALYRLTTPGQRLLRGCPADWVRVRLEQALEAKDQPTRNLLAKAYQDATDMHRHFVEAIYASM